MGFFKLENLLQAEMLPGIRRRAVWMEGVMLTFFTFVPYAVVPEHAHANEQITIVTQGAMAFKLGTERRVLRAGEGVCIPPGVRHGAQILGEPTEAYDAWSPPREDYKL
jgi:quercetin dioxygenase-like cupin family protein